MRKKKDIKVSQREPMRSSSLIPDVVMITPLHHDDPIKDR